jgi:hypothetical protein
VAIRMTDADDKFLDTRATLYWAQQNYEKLEKKALESGNPES